MPLSDPSKNRFITEQILNSKTLMEKAALIEDPLCRFQVDYSAFAALLWCCSEKSTDAEMLRSLKKKISRERRLLDKLSSASRVIVETAQRLFPEGINRLDQRHKRVLPEEERQVLFRTPEEDEDRSKISKNPPRLKEFDESHGIWLGDIVVDHIPDAHLVKFGIELLYQFRCNLVHGAKQAYRSENAEMSEALSSYLHKLNATLVGSLEDRGLSGD